MIKPSDISGVDADLARRVIAEARSIAPCLDSLVDGGGDDDPKPQSDAISIIKGIALEGAARGSRLVKSQRMGPGGVEYFDVASWFSAGDRSALRALCAASSEAGPIGSFPIEQPFRNVWPECETYT